jgi:uncharacterized membrane protein YeaQ/YmgE (transglycosylase-associated protein family)
MDAGSLGAAAAAGAGIGLGMLILMFIVSGMIVGALARLALPGPDPMSWLATFGYGVGGSFLGGILGSLVRLPWILNLALSIGCAAGLIWYFRRRQKTGASGISPPTQPPST